MLVLDRPHTVLVGPSMIHLSRSHVLGEYVPGPERRAGTRKHGHQSLSPRGKIKQNREVRIC